MTVIVALECSDGAILAADSQLTHAGGAPMLATRWSGPKLHAVGGKIAWGASGDVGLSQTLNDTFEDPAAVAALAQLAPEQYREALRATVSALQAAAVQNHIGVSEDESAPSMACIFVWTASDGTPRILTVTENGHTAIASGQAVIGSGVILGTVVLASYAHLEPRSLSVDQGKVVVYRAMSDIIAMAAFGVGHPVSMYVVTAAGIEEVDDPQGELSEAVDAWRAAERDALGALARVPGIDEGLDKPA